MLIFKTTISYTVNIAKSVILTFDGIYKCSNPYLFSANAYETQLIIQTKIQTPFSHKNLFIEQKRKHAILDHLSTPNNY